MSTDPLCTDTAYDYDAPGAMDKHSAYYLILVWNLPSRFGMIEALTVFYSFLVIKIARERCTSCHCVVGGSAVG